jgi:hypothetical protein
MLDFAIRHNIASQVDHFSLNTVYDAIETSLDTGWS